LVPGQKHLHRVLQESIGLQDDIHITSVPAISSATRLIVRPLFEVVYHNGYDIAGPDQTVLYFQIQGSRATNHVATLCDWSHMTLVQELAPSRHSGFMLVGEFKSTDP
jgi:hypothetical protein